MFGMSATSDAISATFPFIMIGVHAMTVMRVIVEETVGFLIENVMLLLRDRNCLS